MDVFRISLAIAALALLTSSAASAESCLDRVNKLAAAHGISADPPTVNPDRTTERKVTPEDLARSGGVIEPPAINDRSVITPPRDTHYRMPTMPEVAKPAEDKKPADGKLSASDQTTLQGILVAARAQAERGMEVNCVERLQQAERLVDRTETASPPSNR